MNWQPTQRLSLRISLALGQKKEVEKDLLIYFVHTVYNADGVNKNQT